MTSLNAGYLPRSGICESGFVFYHCNNGFVGCCSSPACDQPTCPDEDQPQYQHIGPSATDNPQESVSWLPVSTTTPGTITLVFSESTSPPIAGLLSPSSNTIASTMTLTSPLQEPSTTTTDSQRWNDASSLSTAALVGICVGGTIGSIFLLTIVCLLIRRHYIAHAHSSATTVSVPLYVEKTPDERPSPVFWKRWKPFIAPEHLLSKARYVSQDQRSVSERQAKRRTCVVLPGSQVHLPADGFHVREVSRNPGAPWSTATPTTVIKKESLAKKEPVAKKDAWGR
ncbi:uncharacterized protein GGS25DRAFT_532701 [Hypoxylon fragiforme]|uniref:uncharacterized protein n=1 Tax=Hypoxylon fragiforme TaxID=63214 RepID=UPI0020C6CD4F|nr:uncharacterized protein GGS25DRAFT_532701 [Hypoxylon fragiforme]KAI2607634.1 hypothetical protein GGS25DRAFT_532701 [Hypoxylon fragiforme]